MGTENGFFSNASNFGNALQTQVDPRTGQFMLNFPVAELVGNNQLGPALSLSLKYSPLNGGNEGFGIGFSIGLTRFNNRSHSLNLSNGEQYRVGVGSDKVLYQKLKSFRFCYTNGHNDDDGYTIFWKEGKIEKLSKAEDNETFVTSFIISPLGRHMKLSWDWSGQFARLIRIEDEFIILCEINYNTTVHIEVWPNTPDAYKLNFELINDNQLDVIARKVSDSNTLYWNFIYDDVGYMGNRLTITGVNYPTRMQDRVEYQTQDGLPFPDKSGLNSKLPCVQTHTRYVGFGQPETVIHYEYTRNNFLGYNGDFGDWSADSDYLYTTLTDYIYGSTEKAVSGEISIITERTYNNYHLLIAEEVNRQNHIHRTEYSYYAVKYCFIDGQPAQFQLPKEKKVIMSDPMGNVRSLVTLSEFDENGNPTKEVHPDETVTVSIWYRAEGENGCPAEPNGFVRFIKEQRNIPRRVTKCESEYSTKYIYTKLSDTDYVVQKSKTFYCDNSVLSERKWGYDENKSNELGRIVSISDTVYDLSDISKYYISTQHFTTTVKDDQMTQNITFTGHDDLQQTSSRCQSVFSSRLYSETSSQRLQTTYSYDPLGRLVCRKLCPDSEYENVTKWEYDIDSEGLHSIKTDALGNKEKTCFDGTGRAISWKNFDIETGKWYDTASCVRNSFGEIIAETAQDWLTNSSSDNNQSQSFSIRSEMIEDGWEVISKNVNNKSFSLKTNMIHDGWGIKKEIQFSNGIKRLQKIDPINLTESVYNYGSSGPDSLASGSLFTEKDKTSEFPVRKIMKDTMGNEYSRCTYSWNGLGQLLEEQNELQAVTRRTYDPYDRVLTQILPDGTVLKRTYVPHSTENKIASISVTGMNTDGNIQTWLLGTQKFDSLGRLTECASGGRTTVYSYQGASTVPSLVTLPSGKTVTYTYIPELGNLISSVNADGITQDFRYNSTSGKLIMAREAESKVEKNWSSNGQLNVEVFSINKNNRRAEHKYTLNGTPVEYTDIAGKKIHHIMDEHGRTIQIIDDSLTIDLSYDLLGRLATQNVQSGESPTFVTTALRYDSFDREIERKVNDNKGMTLILSQTWQKNSLLATRTTEKNGFEVRQEKFSYDNRNRLISYDALGDSLPVDSYGNLMTSQTYRYDALNNIISMTTTLIDNSMDNVTYHYLNPDDPMQLTKVTHTHTKYPETILLSYDAEGRMTCDEAGRSLTYDVIGRLTGVNGNNGRSGTYSYDALNRLIARKTSENNNDFKELFYRGSELVNEVVNSQEKEKRFIKNGHDCLAINDDIGLTLTVGDKNNSLLLSKNVNFGSNDIQCHVWTPYGSSTSTDNNRLQGFNGEHFDQVSGSYHLGNGYRAYNPVLMRFNCPDSLSPFSAGGINPYAYCAGDPVNYTDPSGHLSWIAMTGITLNIIGLGLSVLTAGMSIAAAGGVMAAISSASASGLVIGSLNIGSDITGIIGGSIEIFDPEASSAFGWMSLALGFYSMRRPIGEFKWLKAGIEDSMSAEHVINELPKNRYSIKRTPLNKFKYCNRFYYSQYFLWERWA